MFPVLRLIRRRMQNRISIRNRLRNRTTFDCFQLSHERFIELYRLNKQMVRMIIERLRGRIHDSALSRGVKIEEKVLSALRFYATGSYQRSIGEEYNLSLSQTSVHRFIREVTLGILDEFGAEYIKFPSNRQERDSIKVKCMEKFEFPGVVGIIDGTHIAVLKPKIDEQNFINRKGFHSLNTQLICDTDLRILNVNSNYGGSTHDSFIFNQSEIKENLRNIVNETCWLLGDSGYMQLPYLMTPVGNPAPHSPEERYNQAHMEARNCVERCIGVLKGRFRCLLRERVARYEPHFVAELIKVCCVLHNMCVDENLPYAEINEDRNQPDGNQPVVPRNQPVLPNRAPNILGERLRQNLINMYFN